MSRLVKQILVVFGALFAVACSSDPLESCADYCFKRETAGCSNSDDCATECKMLVDQTIPECQDELEAVLSCLVETAESCSKPDICDPVFEAYNTCP